MCPEEGGQLTIKEREMGQDHKGADHKSVQDLNGCCDSSS